MLKIDFLAFCYMETVGVRWPGLKDKNSKLSDTLLSIHVTVYLCICFLFYLQVVIFAIQNIISDILEPRAFQKYSKRMAKITLWKN